MKLDQDYTLDARYASREGQVFVTGVQAITRMLLAQARADRAAGLKTAGFVSGYRGSPLGGLDKELWRAEAALEGAQIHFHPGINEELAATAVMGSQQTGVLAPSAWDGVFGLWYGKGPGLDRAGDALKHANAFGASRHGGVLVVAGDDHGAVSSSMGHQSEQLMASWMMPVLNPAGLGDYIDFGLYGYALSRFAGCWVGFKAVSEVVESGATLEVTAPPRFTMPDFEMPPGGLHYRWPDPFSEIESRMHRRLAALAAFAQANRLDRVVFGSPVTRLGIVTTGKAYFDVMEALADAGIDAPLAAKIGLGVYKIGLSWPIERTGALAFARGLRKVIVVEEKRAFVESQLKELMYDLPATARPQVLGKADETGAPLLSPVGELSPGDVLTALAPHLEELADLPQMRARLAVLERQHAAPLLVPPRTRRPYFCSGCPHNTSTRVPEGSMAMAGIGCHFMAVGMGRQTRGLTQMGGEGVNWIGLQPFCQTGPVFQNHVFQNHVFQNLGDGTYFHSGLLAIRQAVAAGVNITYKILYNDAVAMTGGQPHDGKLSVPGITRQIHDEGVGKIIVVTDEPGKYPLHAGFAPGVRVAGRDALDEVQRELRATPGVTALVYDQTCAAEKRRRRKRGTYPDPARRVFINDLVCEACGDCSQVSNCLSIAPKDTPLGRKRAIDQSSCNKDFSCIKGFCPSFVTIKGGRLRRATAVESPADVPLPADPAADKPVNILVTGVGGTGVVTIGQILTMAAHLEGKGASVLDFTGFAQKGGAVISYVRLAPGRDDLGAVRIPAARADVLLGCDMVVAASPEAVRSLCAGVTRAVINSHEIPTADFVLDRNADLGAAQLRDILSAALGAPGPDYIEAGVLAARLMGDAIATNMLLLGYAFQRGLIPLSLEALMRAVELNGVAVAANRRAFAWGRAAAHDPAAVARLAGLGEAQSRPETLDELIESRVAFLTDYQDAAYGACYRARVARVRAAEQTRTPGREALTRAVAQNYFKLLAYKDEYEVARLYSDGNFARALADQFEGDFTLTYHLSPPLLAGLDPHSGRPKKYAFGPWMGWALKLLPRFKGLRGTRLDPFGYSGERRRERRLIADYEADLETLLAALSPQTHALAVKIAALPDDIRGFGPVKQEAIQRMEQARAELLERLHKSAPQPLAAE